VTRVSVIIPVHQPHEPWLREAIDSILRQSLSDLELLIVEDAPRHAPLASDARVRHLVNPTPGLGAALNFAIGRAAAPLVARLDADDIAEPDRLAKQVAMFEADPLLTVAGSQLLVIAENGRPVASRRYPMAHAEIVDALQRYNAIAHPAVMFRKAAIVAAGSYAQDVVAEDYDLWCRLAHRGARFANHAEPLTRYRYHPSLTRANVRRALRATIAVKRKHFGSELSRRARLRLFGERLLLLLPTRLVSALFRLTQLRPPPRRAERDDERWS
jgi:glycosyltransferase involved in cell wall biosynthesis